MSGFAFRVGTTADNIRHPTNSTRDGSKAWGILTSNQ
jgi:hypothetical protein